MIARECGTTIGIHVDSPGVSLRSPCVKESRAINYACPASHVVRVRPINNRWRREVRGLCALHRRSLQRQSITKINPPRNLHSGKSDPTRPSLLGTVGKFNDFVPLVPRAGFSTRKPVNFLHFFGKRSASLLYLHILLYKIFLNGILIKIFIKFICAYSFSYLNYWVIKYPQILFQTFWNLYFYKFCKTLDIIEIHNFKTFVFFLGFAILQCWSCSKFKFL